MVDFSDCDRVDKHLLFEIFDYLCPRNIRAIVFLKEIAIISIAKSIIYLYQNKDNLRNDLNCVLKSYQYDNLVKNVLRKIVAKQTQFNLREVNSE